MNQTVDTILKETKTAALTGTLAILKETSFYDRVKAEIIRNNAAMPSATNSQKRARVVKDFEIIFKDTFVMLIEPLGEQVVKKLFEVLLEMAVVAVTAELAK